MMRAARDDEREPQTLAEILERLLERLRHEPEMRIEVRAGRILLEAEAAVRARQGRSA